MAMPRSNVWRNRYLASSASAISQELSASQDLMGTFAARGRQDRRSVLPNDHLKNTPATLRVGPSDERCSCSTPLQLLEQRPPVADEDSLAGESR